MLLLIRHFYCRGMQKEAPVDKMEKEKNDPESHKIYRITSLVGAVIAVVAAVNLFI